MWFIGYAARAPRAVRLWGCGATFTLALALGCSGDSEKPAPSGPAASNRPVLTADEYTPTPISTAPPLPSGGDASTVDASAADGAQASPTTVKACFQALEGVIPGPDYEKYAPKMSKNCSGTKHQTFSGIEKLVFLGDSVTVGTPPTLPWQYFSARLEAAVKAKYGNIEVKSCAKWGARVDDFIGGGDQIAKCFPSGIEPKKTLVVMTMGGNDVNAWMQDKLDEAQALAAADVAAGQMAAALHWLKDPAHFPKGSDVVFANVYEYTDTSGDLLSCPQAAAAGVSGKWTEGTKAVVRLQEEYLRLAVETGSDMIFLLESFCGHGYRRNDPSLQCYRGPNAELWFDLTCIHPTPKGHEVIANLFGDVILP